MCIRDRKYGVEHGEWGADCQIDVKVGNGQWYYDASGELFGNALNFGEEFDEPGNYVTDDVVFDPIQLKDVYKRQSLLSFFSCLSSLLPSVITRQG